MSYFANVFNGILEDTINEMTTSTAGVGGTTSDQFSSDFYAPGDARIPKVLGQKAKKKTKKKKKKKKKAKKKTKKESKIPVITRGRPELMFK
tara:strand:+ start:2550 stop:2825 length:276 start_codon:yes stop_codon:yes gene_type:complete